MRYVITHGHIFKNAGTTFDSALEKAFGKDFCDHRDDKAMRQGGAEYLKQFILDNPNLKAISSHHLCNPLPVSDEFKCIPVYFLRNPIERVVSVYEFERRQGGESVGAQVAAASSLIDYVRWRLEPSSPKTISNYQTAYLGAQRYLKPSDEVTIDMLNVAVSLIQRPDVLIGFVEKFDDSFNKMSKKLAEFFPDVPFNYENKNIKNAISTEKKYKDALEKLLPVLPEIISANAFDLALYEQALVCSRPI